MNFNNASVPESVQATGTRKKNIQTTKGKVTTRFLWNACRALGVGLLLLIFGTSMAIVGYYADQLSIRSERKGNSTITVKNEHRGFHLNNLSYAGPIIMGIGGFIVVAAWVMTFEARDNAAKVIPARFKPNSNPSRMTSFSNRSRNVESKKNNSSQTIGGQVFGPCQFDLAKSLSRRLLEKSLKEKNRLWSKKYLETNLNRYLSAPNLTTYSSSFSIENCENPANNVKNNLSPAILSSRSSDRESLPWTENALPKGMMSKNLLLHPNFLQRQAFSIDIPEFNSNLTPSFLKLFPWESEKSAESKDYTDIDLNASEEINGSQISMALDLHNYQVTLKVKDESTKNRSDTAKRHRLQRQKTVEGDKEDKYLPFSLMPSAKSHGCHCHQSINRSCIHKMKLDLRSKSAPQCPLSNKKETHQDGTKLSGYNHYRGKMNLSLDNLKIICEDNIKSNPYEYGIHGQSNLRYSINLNKRIKDDGSSWASSQFSAFHRKKFPFVRSNAIRIKNDRKIKNSLSAEEKNFFRNVSKEEVIRPAIRSSSFSPTRNNGKNGFCSRNDSFLENTSKTGGILPLNGDNLLPRYNS